MKEKDGVVNLILIHSKHICKCHNETPSVQPKCANKNLKNKAQYEPLPSWVAWKGKSYYLKIGLYFAY
jgi:hypothetical protein